MVKIAIYIRVSTEDQAKEGYSLEVQREYLESFANREGYQIFKVYNEDGYSGYSTERPAFCDVAFKSATEPFDTTKSAGKLMLQQLGSFAEFERNRLKERIVPGMIKSVKEGNWLGARYAPFGYNYNKETKLPEYPLSGILFCSKCNHKYLGHLAISNHRTKVKKRWYRCSGYQRSFILCRNRSFKAADNLDAFTKNQLLKLVFKNIKIADTFWRVLSYLNLSSKSTGDTYPIEPCILLLL